MKGSALIELTAYNSVLSKFFHVSSPVIYKLSTFMAFIKVPDAWSRDKDKLLIFVCCSPGAACLYMF